MFGSSGRFVSSGRRGIWIAAAVLSFVFLLGLSGEGYTRPCKNPRDGVTAPEYCSLVREAKRCGWVRTILGLKVSLDPAVTVGDEELAR